MEDARLIQAAFEAREHSYSPYSHFRVGAALLTAQGKIYTGCNVESASYSPTCCAELVALFTAVAAGEREFSAIAIVGGFADGRPAAGEGFAYPLSLIHIWITPPSFSGRISSIL